MRNRIDRSEVELTEEKIGKGAFADVFMALYKGRVVAVKELQGSADQKYDRREFTNHDKLSKVQGKDGYPMMVPEYYGRIAMGAGQQGVVMEYMPLQALSGFFEKFPFLGKYQKLLIAYSIAKCMMYVHLEGVIHRDLKPDNILIAGDLSVRLCDFGLSTRSQDLNVSKTNGVGTDMYMAPELLENSHYGREVDVYSYGSVLYSMFKKSSDGTWIMANGKKFSERDLRDGIRYQRDGVPDMYWTLIEKCWAGPGERPSFADIVEYFRDEVRKHHACTRSQYVRELYLNIKKDIETYHDIDEKKKAGAAQARGK